MNLIFDKKTLKIISIIDGLPEDSDPDETLKSMFPGNFSNLGMWYVDKQITENPISLKITLDNDGEPYSLIYKNKEIYRSSKIDKEKNRLIKFNKKKKIIEKKLPKSFIRSIGYDTIKFWMKSHHTDDNIKKSLQDLTYFTEDDVLPISWWGPFTDAGGYANMNREIIFRMHNHHIITKANICLTAPQLSPMDQYILSKYVSFDFKEMRNTIGVWSFTPTPIPKRYKKNIFFTMMETESLHPEFVRICNIYADEIWVPCKHNQRVFKDNGIIKPISVIPLGIDETLYKKSNVNDIGIVKENSFVDLLGRSFNSGINSFKFLTLFGWSFRKGTDILIKSFVREFNSNDDVVLIIVSRHSGSPNQPYVNKIVSDVRDYAKSVRKSDYPQIILYPHIIPSEKMPDIYGMGHAFVSTSRGEGFCLPIIEASARGLPVISCNNTGMGEYLTDDNAFLIKSNEREVGSSELHWISHFYRNQMFCKLGESQIDQTREHMRFVINNFDMALEKGKKLRESVFETYTWRRTAERVAKRIKEIYKS